MKKLLTILLVLTLCGTAWGQSMTVGYTTVGTVDSLTAIDSIVYVMVGASTAGLRFTAQQGDVIDSIFMYTHNDGGSSKGVVCVYEGIGNSLLRVAVDDSIDVTGTAGWRGVDVNYLCHGEFNYQVGFAEGDNTAHAAYWDNASTGDVQIDTSDVLVDPWPGNEAAQSVQYSIYMVIDTSGRPDWGGAHKYQHTDSVESVFIDNDPSGNNNGGYSTIQAATGTAGAYDRVQLIRMNLDLFNPAKIQDSAFMFLGYNDAASDNPTAGDVIYYYKLRAVPFNRGDKFNAVADTCEVTWDSSMATGSGCTPAAWGTPGAQNTSTDRYATVICSLVIPTTSVDTMLRVKIAGEHIDQELIDNGMVGELEAGAFQTQDFVSSKSGVSYKRPFFIGYHSDAAAGSLPVGAATVGVAKVGSQ